MNLLFIGLIALFMALVQKKKKVENAQNADVGSTNALPKRTIS